MKEFEIYPKNVKKETDTCKKIYRNLEHYNVSLERLSKNLKGNSYKNVNKVIISIINCNNQNIQSLKKMEGSLNLIVQLYEKTERDAADISVNKYQIHLTDENTNADDIGNYLITTLKQVLLGDFTEDGNALGTTISVILGFVPGIGQIFDIRDIVADIYNLIDDGAETKEWVALGFSLLAVIPGLGDLFKHADALEPLIKHADDFVDGLSDVTRGVLKKGDDVVSGIGKYVDEINDFMYKNVYSKIGDIADDLVKRIPNGQDAAKQIQNILDKSVNSKDDTVEDMLKEWIKEMSNVEDTVQEWIADGIDSIVDGVNAIFNWNEDYSCMSW